MRKVPVALMAIAIIVVGCSPASTPTPSPPTATPSDEAYILYMRGVQDNEMRAYFDMIDFTADAAEEAPLALCVWNDELRNVTEKLMYALEGAPHPRHPSLQEYHAYWLEAMEKELKAVWHWDKSCASMDVDESKTAVLYEEEVYTLLERAAGALEEYNRTQ